MKTPRLGGLCAIGLAILCLGSGLSPSGRPITALTSIYAAEAVDYATVGGPAWGFTVVVPAAWFYSYTTRGSRMSFSIPNPGALASTVGGISQEPAHPGQTWTSFLPTHSHILGQSSLRLPWGTGISTTLLHTSSRAGATHGSTGRELHAVVRANGHFYHLYLIVTPALGISAEATAWEYYRHMLYSLKPTPARGPKRA